MSYCGFVIVIGILQCTLRANGGKAKTKEMAENQKIADRQTTCQIWRIHVLIATIKTTAACARK